ncbi:hypothetical protein BHE74_00052796 [Ensete ventricosum]|nr:hypothetical protein BHE74_00052796 [Ensete ventricosum]
MLFATASATNIANRAFLYRRQTSLIAPITPCSIPSTVKWEDCKFLCHQRMPSGASTVVVAAVCNFRHCHRYYMQLQSLLSSTSAIVVAVVHNFSRCCPQLLPLLLLLSVALVVNAAIVCSFRRCRHYYSQLSSLSLLLFATSATVDVDVHSFHYYCYRSQYCLKLILRHYCY